ncbi:MAG: hypothetical protein IT175_04185 [Acidobacteria bacterium]|nr:hypothetical protein [Acidobacteriota bacterium]
MRLLLISAFLLSSTILLPGPTRAATTPEILQALPAGDGVVVIEPKAFFGKALPAALGQMPEHRSRLDTEVANIRTDFGIDLASMRSIGVSLFVGADASTSWVAVMTGDLSAVASEDALASKLDAFSRTHPKYSVRKVTHEGKVLFVLPETTAPGAVREDIAVAILDGSTAAYGAPEAVKRAIDVHRGAAPAASSVAALTDALALADPGSPLRFGMPAPQALIAAEMKRDPNNPFLATLANVRMLFGSLDATSLKLTARASTAAQTTEVAAVLSAIIGLGQQATGSKPELAGLFDRMSVSSTVPDATLTAKF